MKKLKKCLSAILAGMLSVSLLGSLAVNADTEKKIYTLSELFEMSEEEFFALDPVDENNPRPTSPKAMYNDLNLGVDHCNFFGNVYTCEYRKYVPYYTEKEIMRLLDVDDIDFVIESSIVTDLHGNGIDSKIWVHDRFYSKDFTRLEIAKIRYCLYQILHTVLEMLMKTENLPQWTQRFWPENLRSRKWTNYRKRQMLTATAK